MDIDKKGLLDAMAALNLKFSRVAGGRIIFAYAKTGDEWIHFKSWGDVRGYVAMRNKSEVKRIHPRNADGTFRETEVKEVA